MTTKFAFEARGCFGVAVRMIPDGSLTGAKAEPFNYTKRTILGIKSFRKALDDEYNRVKSLRGQWGPVGSGYEERYQERWGEELLKTVNEEFCCIAEIMLLRSLKQYTRVLQNLICF